MVYLESFCAAAFTAGSAVCLFNLISPHAQQPPAVFVACLFVTCVLSASALWRVKGPHACWHGSSMRRSGSGDRGANTTAVETAAAAVPSKTGGVIISSSDGITTKEKGGLAEEDAPVKRVGRAATVATAAPSFNEKVLRSESSELLTEEIPLERRSSFVEVALRIHG
ncbi:unnamed protein product [Pylaiella littoralis]